MTAAAITAALAGALAAAAPLLSRLLPAAAVDLREELSVKRARRAVCGKLHDKAATTCAKRSSRCCRVHALLPERGSSHASTKRRNAESETACTPCGCDSDGVVPAAPNSCELAGGQCGCKANVQGRAYAYSLLAFLARL